LAFSAAGYAADKEDEDVLEFVSTSRLSAADGTARVEHTGHTAAIELALDDIKPAILFGGDYSVYVLWAISADGETANLGDLRVDGDHIRKLVRTSFPFSELIVTAEPHFLVQIPSRFVVLHSSEIGVTYKSFAGSYYYERDSLEDALEARGEVRNELKQALTAFQLAQRAGASRHAKYELEVARQALDAAVAVAKTQAGYKLIQSHAREAVRLAVVAEATARRRIFAFVPAIQYLTHVPERKVKGND
jgi:hypothetical protein